MCKYCNFQKIQGSPLEEEGECEWFDEEGNPCEEEAIYQVLYGYVEEHLCQIHCRHLQEELKNGLAEFQEMFGFGADNRFLPIKAGTDTCDHFDPLAPGTECDLPATFAKFVEVEEYLCRAHAAETGYKP